MVGLMKPDKLIEHLLAVPYKAGEGNFSGADCWGVVELWYRFILGQELADRANNSAGHEGLNAGFEQATQWKTIEEPEDNCLVIMRTGRLFAGHVGVFYKGSVLHSDERHGCVCESITRPMVRTKITCFLRFK
jgi:cell wall-associated NlpC family hydrolase